MNLKLTVVLLLFSIGAVSAQQKKWTLEECVAYAVENNLTIEQFELDLKNAGINISDAKGNFMPAINANGTHSWNIGLNQNITTGLLENLTTMFTSVGVNLGVDIFAGFQNVNRLRRSKLNEMAMTYGLENIKDDIKLSVANAYLQILSNKETLKVIKAQFAVTGQDLKRTEELVSAGVLPNGDLLEIEATAAGLEQQIVNTENLVLISRITLAQLLQITDYENFDIIDEDFEIPPSDILNNSPKSIFEKALSFRNDIKQSTANVEVAETDVKIAKGALYPSLNGFYGYDTRASYQDIIGGFERDTDNPTSNIGFVEETGQSVVEPNFRSFTEGPDPLLYQFSVNDGHSFGARLTIPILNGFSVKNNISRSKIAVEKAKLQLEQDRLALETTVNQAYVDVTSFAKAYEAAQKTVEARRLAYEYSKERYDVGLMNAFDFSQAQSRVDNAEAELVRTKYDYIFRLKVLEFYFGIPIELN